MDKLRQKNHLDTFDDSDDFQNFDTRVKKRYPLRRLKKPSRLRRNRRQELLATSSSLLVHSDESCSSVSSVVENDSGCDSKNKNYTNEIGVNTDLDLGHRTSFSQSEATTCTNAVTGYVPDLSDDVSDVSSVKSNLENVPSNFSDLQTTDVSKLIGSTKVVVNKLMGLSPEKSYVVRGNLIVDSEAACAEVNIEDEHVDKDSGKENVDSVATVGSVDTLETTTASFHEDEKLALLLASCEEEQHVDEELKDGGLYFCQMCHKDISHMNSQRRLQHVNNCLDQQEEHAQKAVAVEDVMRKMKTELLNCPMCDARFKLQMARKNHLPSCAKRNGVSPSGLKELLEKQEADYQQSLLSRDIMGEASKLAARMAKAKKGSKKVVKEPNNQYEEDMQMSLALSRSMVEFQTPSAPPRPAPAPPAKRNTKKKNIVKIPPVLVTRTCAERKHILEERVSSLLQADLLQLDNNQMSLKESQLKVRLLDGEVLMPNAEEAGSLWQRCHQVGSDTSLVELYYVERLMPPIQPCQVKTGSKLKGLSQIPGRKKSIFDEVKAVAHQVDTENQDVVPECVEKSHHETLDILNVSDIIQPTGFCTEKTDTAEEPRDDVPAEDSELTAKKDFSAKLLEDLKSMIGNETSSDVSILCKNAEYIPAHRFILAARCPKLLDEIQREAVIELNESSHASVLVMLRYLYGGEVLPLELVPVVDEVTELCKRFELNELLSECNKISKASPLQPENAENSVMEISALLKSLWEDDESNSDLDTGSDDQIIEEADVDEICEFLSSQRTKSDSQPAQSHPDVTGEGETVNSDHVAQPVLKTHVNQSASKNLLAGSTSSSQSSFVRDSKTREKLSSERELSDGNVSKNVSDSSVITCRTFTLRDTPDTAILKNGPRNMPSTSLKDNQEKLTDDGVRSLSVSPTHPSEKRAREECSGGATESPSALKDPHVEKCLSPSLRIKRLSPQTILQLTSPRREGSSPYSQNARKVQTTANASTPFVNDVSFGKNVSNEDSLFLSPVLKDRRSTFKLVTPDLQSTGIRNVYECAEPSEFEAKKKEPAKLGEDYVIPKTQEPVPFDIDTPYQSFANLDITVPLFNCDEEEKRTVSHGLDKLLKSPPVRPKTYVGLSDVEDSDEEEDDDEDQEESRGVPPPNSSIQLLIAESPTAQIQPPTSPLVSESDLLSLKFPIPGSFNKSDHSMFSLLESPKSQTHKAHRHEAALKKALNQKKNSPKFRTPKPKILNPPINFPRMESRSVSDDISAVNQRTENKCSKRKRDVVFDEDNENDKNSKHKQRRQISPLKCSKTEFSHVVGSNQGMDCMKEVSSFTSAPPICHSVETGRDPHSFKDSSPKRQLHVSLQGTSAEAIDSRNHHKETEQPLEDSTYDESFDCSTNLNDSGVNLFDEPIDRTSLKSGLNSGKDSSSSCRPEKGKTNNATDTEEGDELQGELESPTEIQKTVIRSVVENKQCSSEYLLNNSVLMGKDLHDCSQSDSDDESFETIDDAPITGSACPAEVQFLQNPGDPSVTTRRHSPVDLCNDSNGSITDTESNCTVEGIDNNPQPLEYPKVGCTPQSSPSKAGDYIDCDEISNTSIGLASDAKLEAREKERAVYTLSGSESEGSLDDASPFVTHDVSLHDARLTPADSRSIDLTQESNSDESNMKPSRSTSPRSPEMFPLELDDDDDIIIEPDVPVPADGHDAESCNVVCEGTNSKTAKIVCQDGDNVDDGINALLNDSSFEEGTSGLLVSVGEADVTPNIPKKKKKKKRLLPSPFTPMPDYDNMTTPQIKGELHKIGVRPQGKKRGIKFLKHVYEETHQYETDPEYTCTPACTKHSKGKSRQKVGIPDRTGRSRVKSRSVSPVSCHQQPQSDEHRRQPNYDIPLAARLAMGTQGSTLLTQNCSKTKKVCDVFARDSESSEGSPSKKELEGSQSDSLNTSFDSTASTESMLEVLEESLCPDEECSATHQAASAEVQEKVQHYLRTTERIYVKILQYQPLDIDELMKDLSDAGIRCSLNKLLDILDEECVTFRMKRQQRQQRGRQRSKKSAKNAAKKSPRKQK